MQLRFNIMRLERKSSLGELISSTVESVAGLYCFLRQSTLSNQLVSFSVSYHLSIGRSKMFAGETVPKTVPLAVRWLRGGCEVAARWP